MSFTGRFTNLMVRRARPVWRLFWLGHRWAYLRTGGRRFASVVGAPVLCLTVRGRVTGLPRPVLLVFARRGDDLVVCASHAGHPSTPDWYRNLLAAGEADAMVGTERRTVRARQVDGAEREECWRLLVDTFPHDEEYQALSDRRFPIAVLAPA
jgi:deazaflavin-dependent oxidoreductase (nitroreductase family)